MRINTQYIEHLNDFIMWNKKNKNAVDTSNLEVLQIGVGGFTSCGKTLLIDAIFSLFSENSKPHYLPQNFGGRIVPLSTTLGYDNHTVLQNFVRQKIDQAEIQTPLETGTWNLNMYEGALIFNNTVKSIILRNLPGELFLLYYTEEEGIDNKSLNEQFKEYIKRNPNDIKNLFKSGSKEKIESLRNSFFNNYLLEKVGETDKLTDKDIAEIEATAKANKQKVKPLTIIRNKEKHYDNFFAYLYFYTSDHNIYCFDATKIYSDEDKAANADKNFFSTDGEEKKENIIFCVTKFDKIIDRNQFFKTNHSTMDINWYWSLMEKIYSEINIKKDKEEISEDEEDLFKIMLLKRVKNWLSKRMKNRKVVTQEAQEKNEVKTPVVNRHDWERIAPRIGGHENISQGTINLFFTSTAFHNDKKYFFDYESEATEKWTNHNILVRRSLGVLELMLHILKKNGITYNVPHDKYRIISNKIG